MRFFLVRWNYAGKTSLSNCIGVDVREETIEIVDKITIQKAWLGNRTRDSKQMNATETVTETARNTNPVDASRQGLMRVWPLQGGRVTVTRNGSVNTPRTVDVALLRGRCARRQPRGYV